MLSERKSAALTDLLTRMCDGNVDQQQWEALESLLLGDPDAQDFYWEFMVVNVNLEWHAASQPSCLPILPAATEGPESAGEELTGSPSAGVSPGGAAPSFFSPFAVPPFAALQSLAGSAVFSYLAAAVLLGAGVLSAGVWKIGADCSPLIRAGAEAARGTGWAPVLVAKITKADGCQRDSDEISAADGLRVRVGYECYVKGGQLEITYDTGAKVTLQGPAWYAVTSPSGGALYEGTAEISVGEPAHQVLPANKAVPAKEIVAHPLFSLGLPIGLLTDRAAEFGLTVDTGGGFFAKVRRGRVALQMPGCGDEDAIAIGENWSAVSFIQAKTGGFLWEVQLMRDRPLLVDSIPHRRDQPPVVFSGQCPGSIGKWGLERRPGHGSGS